MKGKANHRWDVFRFIDLSNWNNCWNWTGAINSHGYGTFRYQSKSLAAHRVVREIVIGNIPATLECDHICRNRKCVNPWHIDIVTPAVNKARGFGIAAIQSRKTHCKNGHPFSGENLMLRPGRTRDCRTCHRIQARKSVRKWKLHAKQSS